MGILIKTLWGFPRSASKSRRWRTFKSRDAVPLDVMKKLMEESGYRIGTCTEGMIKNLTLTERVTGDFDTIILTATDFGYRQEPTTGELFNRTRLADWSRKNKKFLSGRVVDLLPGEAGLYIREQYAYADQPRGEILLTAMERIPDAENEPCIFTIGRNAYLGCTGINGFCLFDNDKINLAAPIVFLLK